MKRKPPSYLSDQNVSKKQRQLSVPRSQIPYKQKITDVTCVFLSLRNLFNEPLYPSFTSFVKAMKEIMYHDFVSKRSDKKRAIAVFPSYWEDLYGVKGLSGSIIPVFLRSRGIPFEIKHFQKPIFETSPIIKNISQGIGLVTIQTGFPNKPNIRFQHAVVIKDGMIYDSIDPKDYGSLFEHYLFNTVYLIGHSNESINFIDLD